MSEPNDYTLFIMESDILQVMDVLAVVMDLLDSYDEDQLRITEPALSKVFEAYQLLGKVAFVDNDALTSDFANEFSDRDEIPPEGDDTDICDPKKQYQEPYYDHDSDYTPEEK